MIRLTPLDSYTLTPYQVWLLADAEAQWWTGADTETLAYHLEYGHVWLASDDGEPVALVLDSPEEGGGGEWTVTLVVAPERRGQGVGRRVLQAYAAANAEKTLLAAIHQSHVTSQKVFAAANFELLDPPNEEGFAVYRRALNNTTKEDSTQ